MQSFVILARAVCATAALIAIAAHAESPASPPVSRPESAPPRHAADPALARVKDYQPVFQLCEDAAKRRRLAIRRMKLDADGKLLLVDPATLATSLDAAKAWTCADTSDEAQKNTRYINAVQKPAQKRTAEAMARNGFLRNAGLTHGVGEGSFITGDLCPSTRPLDRGFIEMIEKLGPQTPIALSISGLWLTHHDADFQWLRQQAREKSIAITWVNHSFHHPWFPERPMRENFLLAQGFDIHSEILYTERLLIAHGEAPSVFFRFPGLISDTALMDAARADHLIVLGADGWLVLSPPPRPGGVILVHPNGNEPLGLKLFAKMIDADKLPRPFRPIAEAP